MHDLQLHRIGDRRVLQPLFEAYSIPKNSDYYPVLDTHAARTRFMNRGATELAKLMVTAGVPMTRLLIPVDTGNSTTRYTANPYLAASVAAYDATLVRDYLATGQTNPQYDEVLDYLKTLAQNLRNGVVTCETELDPMTWVISVVGIAQVTLPFLSPVEQHSLWEAARQAPCYATSGAARQKWIQLMLALADRDVGAMRDIAVDLLNTEQITPPFVVKFLLQAAMLGEIAGEHRDAARKLWEIYAPLAYPDRKYDILARLYMASAGVTWN